MLAIWGEPAVYPALTVAAFVLRVEDALQVLHVRRVGVVDSAEGIGVVGLGDEDLHVEGAQLAGDFVHERRILNGAGDGGDGLVAAEHLHHVAGDGGGFSGIGQAAEGAAQKAARAHVGLRLLIFCAGLLRSRDAGSIRVGGEPLHGGHVSAPVLKVGKQGAAGGDENDAGAEEAPPMVQGACEPAGERGGLDRRRVVRSSRSEAESLLVRESNPRPRGWAGSAVL